MQNKNEQENYFQSIHPPVFFHRRANIKVDRKSGIDVTESINGKTIEYRGKQLKIKL